MSNSRYSVSSSPGGNSYQAPPLYDTSTSTADSFGSGSSQRLRRSYDPLTASNLRMATASSPANAHTNTPNNPFASGKRAYPAPNSEPGVAMMDDRPRRISTSASDVGVGSVSEQIRRYNRRKEASMDRVMQAREAFQDTSSAEPSTPPRGALDQSFDSSVTPSIQDLKRQLWNDQEVLRGSPRQTHRPTTRTRSLSPAIRQTQSSGSIDSKFNSKYYTAALVANSRGYDEDSPPRQTVSRDRRDSKETYCSAPYDEGGRKADNESPSRPPTTYQAIPPIRRSSNASADTNKSQSEAVAAAAISKPPAPTFQRSPVNASPKATVRGRSPSRLIQQRVREFSRDRNSQPALPRKPVTKPRSTSQPRARRDSESSFERLAREFNGELVQIHQTLAQQEVMQLPPDEPPSLATVPPSPAGTKESQPVSQASAAPHYKDQARSQVPPLHKSGLQAPVPTKASKPPSVRSASPRSYSSNQRPSPKTSPKSSYQPTRPVAPRATPSPQSVPSITPNMNLPSLSTPNSKREVATPQIRPPTPQTPPNKESTSKASQSKSTEPAVSVAIDQPNVADLVAKLAAVNRSNPEEALAQIDSILRQAGQAGTSTSLAVLDTLKAQEEYVSDDDDTSVSSITNPSFMPTKHSPGGTHALTAGRPRPTQLHNYMPANLHPGVIPALGGTAPRYAPSPPNPFGHSNPLGLAEERAFKVSVNEQRHGQFGKLDNYVADQDALAAKIKVWDDMSRGGADTEEKKLDSPVRVLPTSPRPEARRPHPWDDEIPPRLEKLDMRDTSMENAVGIEAAMTNRQSNNNSISYNEDVPVSEENSYTHRGSTPRSSPAKEEEFMPRGRNEMSVPRGTIPIQGSHEATKTNPFYDAYGGGTETTPRFTPQQQQHTRKISSAFDRAYASMPGARFHPVSVDSPSAEQPAPHLVRHSSILSDPEPRSAKGPIDLDESFSSAQVSAQTPGPTRMPPPKLPQWPIDGYVEKDDEERGAIEVSLLPDDLNFSNESSDPSGDGGKPKKRGFLRAFMRREKKRNPKSKSQEGNQSVSMASSGVHSMPAKVPTNAPTASNPPHVRSMPLPPGVDIQEMPPPRGRFGRNPPGRSRSASLERFQRSSSMAQKFGRVMRLYDQD